MGEGIQGSLTRGSVAGRGLTGSCRYDGHRAGEPSLRPSAGGVVRAVVRCSRCDEYLGTVEGPVLAVLAAVRRWRTSPAR